MKDDAKENQGESGQRKPGQNFFLKIVLTLYYLQCRSASISVHPRQLFCFEPSAVLTTDNGPDHCPSPAHFIPSAFICVNLRLDLPAPCLPGQKNGTG